MLDIVLGRQLEAVFADKEILRETLSGVLNGGHAVVSTEQQTDGRVVVSLHHLMLVVVHVEVQLLGILVVETVNLQIDDDVAFQDAVVAGRRNSSGRTTYQEALPTLPIWRLLTAKFHLLDSKCVAFLLI